MIDSETLKGIVVLDSADPSYDDDCHALGIHPVGVPIGLALIVDGETGERRTLTTREVDKLRFYDIARHATPTGTMRIPDIFAAQRAGWPDDWQVGS